MPDRAASCFLRLSIPMVLASASLLCSPSAASGGAAKRIMPDDLVYRGAFRLPDGPEDCAWAWSGQALAYRADGDPKGAADGHPGSIFGCGHNWHQHVTEIGIPRPAVSASKSAKALPVATKLQKFQDIRGKAVGVAAKERRVDEHRVRLAGDQRKVRVEATGSRRKHLERKLAVLTLGGER